MTKAISQLIEVPQTTTAIRTLKANDIYKRLETSSYAGPKIIIGIVTSVMANGEGDLAVVTIEFTQGYKTTAAEQKVYAASDTVSLFPITVEEFGMNVDQLREGARESLRQAEDAVRKQRDTVDFIEGIQYGTFGVQEAEVGEPDVSDVEV